MTPSKWAVPSVTRGEVDRAGRLLAENGGLAGEGPEGWLRF